jgi:hypothetical protein
MATIPRQRQQQEALSRADFKEGWPTRRVRRNARQEVSTFRGAGLRRCARKIRRTVASQNSRLRALRLVRHARY